MNTQIAPITGVSNWAVPAMQKVQQRRLLLLVVALSLVIGYIPGANLVTYPLSLFVTYIHEGGHAVMTLLTGGQVEGIAVRSNMSGVTYSLGGLSFLIFPAGYLGATLFGAGCLLLGRRAGSGRNSLRFMAIAVLLVTLLWIGPASSPFGFIAGLSIAVGLFIVSGLVSGTAADFLAAFLAVQLCLNALWDIRALIWLTMNTTADNDAVFMAQAYGLTPWFWALTWAAGALVILFWALRAFWRGSRQP